MSKSFEDIFKDRLGTFEKTPPSSAKRAVLGQLAKPWLTMESLYQGLAAFLILLCFYQIGKIQPLATVSKLNSVNESLSKLRPNQQIQSSGQNLVEAKKSIGAELHGYENDHEVVRSSNPVSSSLDLGFNSEEVMNPLQSIELDYSETMSYSFNGLSGPIKHKTDKKRIVPKADKAFEPYYNAGAFFVYNRVTPNLTDDIYVGEYDSPFGVSPSRIGLTLEAGIHKRWNDWMASRLGISINNFNQSYSFTVRSTKPDSVAVSSSDGFLEPHFDKEHVRINKRVTMIGLKGQMFWYVFPNQANVLFSSFEYQHLISSGPKFNYEGRNYNLMQPSQILSEIGLRKLIADRRNAELYLMPAIRYSFSKSREDDMITVRPFSVGITISYQLK